MKKHKMTKRLILALGIIGLSVTEMCIRDRIYTKVTIFLIIKIRHYLILSESGNILFGCSCIPDSYTHLPLLAPFTSPAISTISTVVGTIRWGCTNSASAFRRSSGTVITPTSVSYTHLLLLADINKKNDNICV